MKSGDLFYANEMVVYSCNEYYDLVDGDLLRTCQSDGQFSGEAPTCSNEGKAATLDMVNSDTHTYKDRKFFFIELRKECTKRLVIQYDTPYSCKHVVLQLSKHLCLKHCLFDMHLIYVQQMY